MATQIKDRSHWVVKKCSSFEDMRIHRIQQWQERPFMERLDAAWEIIEDAWEIKQKDPNELRFQRSITTVVRRDLITSKKTAGRPQDIADIDELNRVD